MKKGNIYIGTSGWHYKHWKSIFYPKDLNERDQLDYYVRNFTTVEINNSFYRLPELDTFVTWYKKVPDSFIFSVKGSRFISHLKKLKVDQATVTDFIRRAEGLQHKLGPILFQLPPSWNVNIERFRDFLLLLPAQHRFAFEFRNHSWNSSAIYEILDKHGCAYCIYDLAGYQSPVKVTADFVYIRLHGPGEKYQGKYDDTSLREWAELCTSWQTQGKDIFVYFDNDQNAYATVNAASLAAMTKSSFPKS